MKKYLGSIVAVRFTGKGMELGTAAVRLQAENIEDALAAAELLAVSKWPPGDFWGNHSAAVDEEIHVGSS